MFELLRSENVTYDLAIKVVLLDHDDVDSFWIFESQETETSRAACCAVAHYRAFENLAKLREIVFE
jgi:hypothetical protein